MKMKIKNLEQGIVDENSTKFSNFINVPLCFPCCYKYYYFSYLVTMDMII